MNIVWASSFLAWSELHRSWCVSNGEAMRKIGSIDRDGR
jgi:hypothetical protein